MAAVVIELGLLAIQYRPNHRNGVALPGGDRRHVTLAPVPRWRSRSKLGGETLSKEVLAMEPTGYGPKIMVGIDGSPGSTAALGWAMREAPLRNASVEALFVWQTPSLAYSAPGFIPFSEAEIEDQGRRALEQSLAALPEASDVKVYLRVNEGNPAEVIARVANEPEVGLVVVGTRGHGGVAGLLLGSVSHSLTHTSTKPLVIVPRDWPPLDPAQVRPRVVVGVDGSKPADEALRWAAEEAVLRECTLQAVMVYSSPLPVLPAHVPLGAPKGGFDRYDRVREMLERAVGRVYTGTTSLELSVAEGSPARTLVRLAEQTHMLVVGTRGFGRAHEAVSGSVSHACSHRATVPIAVIPHGKGSSAYCT
jgi:nucleotide-binding universal stress UspA family protein